MLESHARILDIDWLTCATSLVSGSKVSLALTVQRERDLFVDNLLIRIHLMIEMILVDWLCAMGVWIPFSR